MSQTVRAPLEPGHTAVTLGICGAILCAQSGLISVVAFTAVLIIILYALIAISAIFGGGLIY